MTEPNADRTTPEPGAPEAPVVAPGRRIELEVEVPGTPEEVWEAVATGPGISSWFIPMEVEPRAGGRVSMHWGPAFGDAEGDVRVWDPPHRFVMGTADEPLAYEWLVEARGGGACVVRLVNSGFGADEAWDEQFHGMAEGWKLFLAHLQVQRQHFAGRWAARTVIPTSWTDGPHEAAWQAVCDALGIDADLQAGDPVATRGPVPPLAGRVAQRVETPTVTALVLVLDQPHPGTAFVTAEGDGDRVALSTYLFLYDEPGRPVDPEVAGAWERWLGQRFPAPAEAEVEAGAGSPH